MKKYIVIFEPMSPYRNMYTRFVVMISGSSKRDAVRLAMEQISWDDKPPCTKYKKPIAHLFANRRVFQL